MQVVFTSYGSWLEVESLLLVPFWRAEYLCLAHVKLSRTNVRTTLIHAHQPCTFSRHVRRFIAVAAELEPTTEGQKGESWRTAAVQSIDISELWSETSASQQLPLLLCAQTQQWSTAAVTRRMPYSVYSPCYLIVCCVVMIPLGCDGVRMQR